MERVDPAIAEVLAAFPIDLGQLSAETLPVVRELIGSTPGVELSDDVERTDHTVPADGDHPEVTLRVHRPKGASGALPCVYWMHGGGLVMGSFSMDDLRFDRWCAEYGIVGVSVEYRLAPETPYPGPHEDCYRGLVWVFENASTLGVDPDRIGIGGASAGGGLAAGVALRARDEGRPPVAFQLLVYPMLDDRQITASSSWEVPVWPPAANTFGWAAYLGDARGEPDVPVYAAPARATELAGLPPTLVVVGSADGFVDEDVDYATRLNVAGVSTELHVYPGAPHGFDGIAAGTALGQRCNRDVDEWLEARLAP